MEGWKASYHRHPFHCWGQKLGQSGEDIPGRPLHLPKLCLISPLGKAGLRAQVLGPAPKKPWWGAPAAAARGRPLLGGTQRESQGGDPRALIPFSMGLHFPPPQPGWRKLFLKVWVARPWSGGGERGGTS